jgi:hypothetical protein
MEMYGETVKFVINTFWKIFLPQMRRRNWNMARLCFQQDGATADTARLTMNTLLAAFPGRILSRFGDIQWPSNSPDFTAVDFFYGGI